VVPGWLRNWKSLHDEAIALIHQAADDSTRRGRRTRMAYRAGLIHALLWATEQGWRQPRKLDDLQI
jgi:hypothetical protein